MEAESDDSICTLADPLAYEVVVKVLDGTILCAELVLSWLAILRVLEHLVLWVTLLFLNLLIRLLFLGLRCRLLLSFHSV